MMNNGSTINRFKSHTKVGTMYSHTGITYVGLYFYTVQVPR